jgi:hypothetical protein
VISFSIPALLLMVARSFWASLFTRQPSPLEALRLRAEVAERGCVCLRRELEAERAKSGGAS